MSRETLRGVNRCGPGGRVRKGRDPLINLVEIYSCDFPGHFVSEVPCFWLETETLNVLCQAVPGCCFVLLVMLQKNRALVAFVYSDLGLKRTSQTDGAVVH